MTSQRENPKLQLLSEADLRSLFSVSHSSIYRLIRSGEIPAGIRLGRSVRWPLETIEAWLKARQDTYPPEKSCQSSKRRRQRCRSPVQERNGDRRN